MIERVVAVLTVVSSLGSAVHGYAADAADCQTTDDPLERLACYDRLHGRPGSDDPAAPAQGQDAAAASIPEASAPEAAAAPPAAADQSPGPADVTVESAGADAAGRRWYRTSSGDLWRQVNAQRTDIRPGDTVRITESGIGTFHLRRADGSSRSVQVRLITP